MISTELVYTEMGFLDSLFERDSRKFIKRKDSDAGEAGDFIFPLFFFFLIFLILFYVFLVQSLISGIWGCVFPFFFLFLSIALWFSNPNSSVFLEDVCIHWSESGDFIILHLVVVDIWNWGLHYLRFMY